MKNIHMRRAEDNRFMKKFWDKWTPYIQIASYLPVIGGMLLALYMASIFINNTQAYGKQIEDLQEWRTNTQIDLAIIKQEVHDIHDVVVKR